MHLNYPDYTIFEPLIKSTNGLRAKACLRSYGFHGNKQVRQVVASIATPAETRDVTERWAWSARVIGC